ncbi:MAG: cyclase family protein [Candidatus Leucobacter sulfamidivorax]|nr:cyclase family protein [Candidatus Leucobacter sulfamidivorax]
MTVTGRDTNWGGGSWDGLVSWPEAGSVRAYDLAVRLEHGMTHHAAHPPFSYTLVKKHGEHPYPGGISSSMELLTMGAHVGTHVDAPGHISLDGCVFGGREVDAQQESHSGIAVGSVEELPPLFGPGHLVDGVEIFDRVMTHEDGFGAEELEAWFSGRPEPKAGDIVVFRTGWMQFWEDSDRYLGLEAGIPGVKLSGARWLSERGVRAVGADTVNFEHKPQLQVPALSVHVHLLVENGIPIMESLSLEQLAADGIRDFFFAASPLRIGGGTGSPIRPLAFAPA